MRVNQTDATAVRRCERMPSGFVNCAADYTAPFRLARMLRVGSNKNSPLPFLLAHAHVAGCGWLGIHEPDNEAFGFVRARLLWFSNDVICFTVKTVNFNALKEQEARSRMADLRKARRSPQAAAKIQRRVSLVGNGAKWRITNLNQVARAIAKW